MDNRQTVLIIEDSPLTVKILRNMLESDYKVISAFSGADGYDMAVEQNPDIIILDIIMTKMDGYEVCEKLKRNELTRDIPVIFISALGEMEDERKGLEIGAIDYITKPFSEPIVKIRVKNHLELKRSRDILSELSSLDGLTGLYNRRYFDNSVEKEWKKAIINKTPFSLMLLDIDKFKLYNDNYGHLEGDECLKLIAQIIKKTSNNDDSIVARFGGEEFVCLLPNYDLIDTRLLAEKVQKQIRKLKVPFSFSTVANIVTMSIGLASVYPTEALLLADFIKNVDDLLYEAKRNGRNQIQFKQL